MCGVVERGASSATSSASPARHSTASAPCPGAGSICSGSSTSVDLVEPAEPGQAGAGEHDGVVARPTRTLPIRVSTLPRIADDLETEAERVQLGGPARRAGADAAAGRQLAEGEAVAGDDDVARVLARRARRPARCRRAGSVGQVLERVHGDVDVAAQQRVAQRADEDAGAAERWPAARR